MYETEKNEKVCNSGQYMKQKKKRKSMQQLLVYETEKAEMYAIGPSI